MKRFSLLALAALVLSSVLGCAMDVRDSGDLGEQGYELDVQAAQEQPQDTPSQPGDPVNPRTPPNGGPTPYPWAGHAAEPNDPKDPTPYPWTWGATDDPTNPAGDVENATKDTTGTTNTTH
ncbi:MAG: hypothetical protein KC776_40385 [Myxococcales bacterium]|nr:hypothetical protein [Myxococcales bacterium]MCB9582962.1 hypothetical protein [Polyangiaceae bacterium]